MILKYAFWPAPNARQNLSMGSAIGPLKPNYATRLRMAFGASQSRREWAPRLRISATSAYSF